MDAAIKSLLKIFVETPTADDEEVVHELVRTGLSNIDAERLVAFVPMACARAILAEMGAQFPDTYIVRDHASGHETRARLADEPVFKAAQSFIAEHGVSSDAVRLLASGSAEMAVARQLLGTGQDATDIRFTETLLARLPVHAVRTRKWWPW